MKKILAMLLALLILLTLVSCNRENNKASGDGEQNQSESVSMNYTPAQMRENMNKMIREKGLYVELAISGRDPNGQVEQETMAYGETATAFYFRADGEEVIADFSNDAYAVIYERDVDEAKWEKETIVYAEEGISKDLVRQECSAYTTAMLSYLESYSDLLGLKMEKSAHTVAGRNCDRFVYNMSMLGVGMTYTFSVDKETGMCLNWNVSASALGQGVANADFTCTKFQTPYTVTIPSEAEIELFDSLLND